MTTELLLWLLPLPPLAAFMLIVLGGNRSRVFSHTLAVSAAALSWLGSMIVFFTVVRIENLAMSPVGSAINWLPVGIDWFTVGVSVDPLSAVTLFFVAWTILAIFIYSIGYHNFNQPVGVHDVPGLPPHGALETSVYGKVIHVPSVEPMYSRFFAYIGLFAFAMYVLVISDNLLTLYVGWEIMGLCSYLLIGFWYAKESARDAAIKAFLTTRVGDVFMLLGLASLYFSTGSLRYDVIFAPEMVSYLNAIPSGLFGLSIAGLSGLLLFIGTVGKSAQFPLHIWLPDAMEGPTPVSAMIHAATMVSAGVYLSIRAFPLISVGWEPGLPLTAPMFVLALVGTFTAFFAASIALAQNDIKRVLAFSTISQLGFMVASLGVGSYIGAAFHLVTHAFFKALLFLGSGSVIHGMEHGVLHSGDAVDVQDMWNMGGLKAKMPFTFWTFLAGGLSLAGFPLITAGFWSKDEILAGAYSGGFMLVFTILAITAFITAFYTARQIALTFLGEARSEAAIHAHESVKSMTYPLVGLAIFAIAAGWFGVPAGFPIIGGHETGWFQSFLAQMNPIESHAEESHSLVPLFVSLAVSLGGLVLGWQVYRKVRAGQADPAQKVLGGFYTLLKNKYYVDEVYSAVLIRPAVWISERFTSQWLDKKVIDGVLHAFGNLTPNLGGVLRNGFDKPVISDGGDALGTLLSRLGNSLRRLQTGRVQQYMLMSIWVMIISLIVIYYFLMKG